MEKVVLFIGETGMGKSTLCNAITSSQAFMVSSGTESCTQEVRVQDGLFRGDDAKPITIIDTVGFNDGLKESDDSETTALIRKLKSDLSHINLFVIVLDGNNPRIDKSQKDMLRLFGVVFGPAFWKHVLIVFTKMSMLPRNVKVRMNDPGRGSDDTWAERYVQGISDKVGTKPKYLFIDAKYDKETPEEETAFQTAMDKLYDTLISNEGFKTDSVRDVELNLDIERRKREEAEKEKEAAERKRVDAERERNLANKKREEAETESQRKVEEAVNEKRAEELKRKRAEEEMKELQKKAEKNQKDIEKRIEDLERQKEEETKQKEEERLKREEAEEEKEKELVKKRDAEKERKDLREKRDQAEAERDKAKAEKEEERREKENERRRIREKDAELEKAHKNAEVIAKQRKEEEERRKGEELRRREEESKRQEEESMRKDEEKKRRAIEAKLQEEEKKRRDEETKRQAEELKRREEERQREAAEAKLKEEETKRKEEERIRKAEVRQRKVVDAKLQEEAVKRRQTEVELAFLKSEREKEKSELEETKRQLKERIDFMEEQEQLKRRSLNGTSITEETESFVDEEGAERVAHQMKKESTQIERGRYKTLKIYKPPTQHTNNPRFQVFGEQNEKETSKTLMVLGAHDRGKDIFINSLVNHLWEVKVPDRFRFKLVFNNEEASSCTVYKLNNLKEDYNVTIVNVPEFDGDEEPSVVLKSIVTDCKELGLTRFHAICYVVRAPDRRLSSGEKEVFAKVPKIFAKSPDVNIIANFSDDAEPTIKHALINENITYANIFKLNTIFIENGASNFEEFLDYLNSTNSPQDLEYRSRSLFGTIGKSFRNARRRVSRGRSGTREKK